MICVCHLHDNICVGFDVCDDDLDEDDQFKDDPISHIDVKVVNECIKITCIKPEYIRITCIEPNNPQG